MSTYFLLDPFEFPYYFYCILGELIYVLSIVACIPSTFCPTLGHHQGRIYYNLSLHEITSVFQSAVIFMSCRIMKFKICIFRQHFFVNANFIKHNRHFMSTYFLLDPFEFPYYFYCILGELIYVLSIVACIPSTFCPTLGHHQGRIYYNLSLHEITSVFQSAVIFMSCRIMKFKICIFRQHFFVNANFIKHNRHFMSTYFLLDPFEFPYYFYCILGELIYVLSIVACIPSTFCPTLGHHQGRIYYNLSLHEITSVFQSAVIFMSCRIMKFKICIFRQHFFVNANFIKHNRHFMSTYFLLDPFEFPYYFYCILGELIYVLSIVACIPSTFCPTLGHHQGRIYYNLSLHEITSVFQSAVIFMSCRIMKFKICIFRQHFFVNANFIKHNRHFMSTYFLLDPFEFPYYFYRILGELIYVLSIVACIPSTFCPTLGHHQGRIYYGFVSSRDHVCIPKSCYILLQDHEV